MAAWEDLCSDRFSFRRLVMCCSRRNDECAASFPTKSFLFDDGGLFCSGCLFFLFQFFVVQLYFLPGFRLLSRAFAPSVKRSSRSSLGTKTGQPKNAHKGTSHERPTLLFVVESVRLVLPMDQFYSCCNSLFSTFHWEQSSQDPLQWHHQKAIDHSLVKTLLQLPMLFFLPL